MNTHLHERCKPIKGPDAEDIRARERVLVRVVLDTDFRTQHLPQERDELQQSQRRVVLQLWRVLDCEVGARRDGEREDMQWPEQQQGRIRPSRSCVVDPDQRGRYDLQRRARSVQVESRYAKCDEQRRLHVRASVRRHASDYQA